MGYMAILEPGARLSDRILDDRPSRLSGVPSTKVIDMSDKAAKIKEMIAMQKKFIEYEHKNGVDPKDYFVPSDDHELSGYRQKYRDLAMEVVDMAHAEAGSHR
jgi:hypothetical protein